MLPSLPLDAITPVARPASDPRASRAHDPQPPPRPIRAPGTARIARRLAPWVWWLSALGTAGTPGGGEPPPAPASPGRPITFNRDIAPIVHRECAPCHRPGESGPFTLLTYADVKPHAEQIAEVTRTRLMPPWLPEEGHEPLLEPRRLTTTQIAALQEWVKAGAPEGDPADRPPTPQWTEGWQLGPPDLVVTMPEPFLLPADTGDVYRNFVIPVPTTARRYVRAFEFRASSRAVHHAFLRFDGTGEARKLDARDSEPGFAAMDLPPAAETPTGHFLTWQPGRGPSQSPPGLAWPLAPRADLVLLMHMQPIGKPERVQPSVGFYFTDVPPTNSPTKIGLRSYAIDIPPGAARHVVEDSVRVPVDTDLLAVVAHAHYLAREVEAFALPPDGPRRILLRIPAWDFKWQGEYRFAQPVAVPAGTTLGMRWVFDNSTNNVVNPHVPPIRVTWGLETTDEMAELYFQALARNPADRARLEKTAQDRTFHDMVQLNLFRVREDPEDAEALAELGKVALVQGNAAGAEQLFRRVIQLRPSSADAQYHLGLVLLQASNLAAAEQAFLEALRLNPEHFQARNNAGLCCLRQGRPTEAANHFQEVLRLRPGDTVARGNLEAARQAIRRRAGPP